MKRIGVLSWLLSIAMLFMASCATHQHLKMEYPTSSSELPAIVRSNPVETEPPAVESRESNPTEISNFPKISNTWEETDIKIVLQDIADQAGINILWDDSVAGMVTLKLEGVPLEEALKIILKPRGYVFKKMDSMHYIIGSGEPGTPSALVLSETEIIVTNKPAEEVLALLSPDLIPFVKAAKGGHLLSVSAPPEIIKRIQKDIEVLDLSQPLVVIEVLVTEVKRMKAGATGIDWSQILDVNISGNVDLKRGTELAYAGVLKWNLVSSVQMLAEQGKLNLRANPQIVIQAGEEGEINITKDKYTFLYEATPTNYGTSPYYWYPRFEAKPIQSGVSLKVTPQLSRDGTIILNLKAEVSDMDQATNNKELPLVNKRSTKTIVRVRSGETVVLGGLTMESSKEVRRGVPILNRIPVLNFFFQRKKIEKEVTEVILFVTPKLLEK